MKIIEQDRNNKRLQRNTNRRRRYAQLSEEKKADLLRKRRENYAKKKLLIGHPCSSPTISVDSPNSKSATQSLSKMRTPEQDKNNKRLQRNTNERRRYAKLPEEKKAVLLRKRRENYAEKKLLIGHGDKEISLSATTNKGKVQLSFYSSFDIGSSSSNQTATLRNELFPLHDDFPISRTRPIRHITAITSDRVDNVETHRQITAHESAYQQPPSRKRKRTKLNKVGDEESNTVDEIQRFQSGRWISAVEAMWRIFRFTSNEMRPAVQSLHLHLEGYIVCIQCSAVYRNILLPISKFLGNAIAN